MAQTKELPREVREVVHEVAKVAGYLWDRQWAERYAGHISVDVTAECKSMSRPRTGGLVRMNLPGSLLANGVFLVTLENVRMSDLAHEPERHIGIVKISGKPEGYRVLYAPPEGFVPPRDILAHLHIHQSLRKQRRSERAIINAHPDALVALTHIVEFKDDARLNAVLLGMHPDAVLIVHAGVRLVPYGMPGSKEQAEATALPFDKGSVALLEKRGAIGAGKSILDAFDVLDTLEKSARIYFFVRAAGRTPEGLSDDQLAQLRTSVPDHL